MLEVLTESIGETLEERLQVRRRELLEANEKLRAQIAARRRIEEQIKHMAYHDFLTDLPNRLMLASRLAEEISLTQRGIHVALQRKEFHKKLRPESLPPEP